MQNVAIIGVDLAKRTFQLHGARADGSVAFRKKLTHSQFFDLSGGTIAVRGGHGSLRDGAWLGPGDREAGPHREVDRDTVRDEVSVV